MYGVGMMCTECPTCEGILANTSNMKEIRQLAETYPEVEHEIKDSVKSSKGVVRIGITSTKAKKMSTSIQ